MMLTKSVSAAEATAHRRGERPACFEVVAVILGMAKRSQVKGAASATDHFV